MSDEISTEALAERLRDYQQQVREDVKELKRRGYDVDLRRKVPRVTKTETKTIEL